MLRRIAPSKSRDTSRGRFIAILLKVIVVMWPALLARAGPHAFRWCGSKSKWCNHVSLYSCRHTLQCASLSRAVAAYSHLDDTDGGLLGEYSYHIPVLRDECCNQLAIEAGRVFVDCTLGGGGHTRAMLERGAKVIALDQDPDAVAESSRVLESYISSGQCEIIQSNFRHIQRALSSSRLLQDHISAASSSPQQPPLVDGILMDLGISSYQIDMPRRGFAFAADGPLDMRMNKEHGIRDAAEILNTWEEEDIANILYQYGDERRSRVLAREIVARRPLHSTSDLVAAIASVTAFKQRPKTLARCFQAVRIVVNDEIAALEEALTTADKCLKPGGRLAVISYHSLEDRRVKWLFRTGLLPGNKPQGRGRRSYTPTQQNMDNSITNPWNVLNRRAITPSAEELARNRRSRSAKLRIAEKLNPNKYDKNQEASMAGAGRRKKSFPRMGAKQLAKQQKRRLDLGT